MTVFLAHVPPAGLPHYGLDKTEMASGFSIPKYDVCACVMSHPPGSGNIMF